MSSLHRPNSNVWPGGPSLQGPHRVGSFAMCPQLEAFAHEIHLRPVIESMPSAVGTLIHAGLAYRYAAMLPVKPDWFIYKDGYDAIRTLAGARTDFAELALHVFTAYEDHYRVNTWKPLLVEHQFIVRFGNGEPYSARTDLLAEENGEVILIDHKSVGKLYGGTAAAYSADRQMLTGLAIARANGWNVTRVVINAMSRERPFPAFRRYDVPINEAAFNRLGEDTLYYLDRMAETRLKYPDPMNRPRNWDACTTKFNNGLCDFFGLCTGTDGLHSFKVPEEHVDGRLKKGT